MSTIYTKLLQLLKDHYLWVVIVLLLLMLVLATKQCSYNQEHAAFLEARYDTANTRAQIFKLGDSIKGYRIRALQVAAQELRGRDIQSYIKIQGLEKQVGSLKNVVSITQGKLLIAGQNTSHAVDTVFVKVSGKDTTKTAMKSFTFANKWLQLQEVYNPKTDTIGRLYKYTPTFTVTEYYRGKNFFKRGELVSDLTFDDPAVQVTSFKQVVVKQPPKQWYETRLVAVAFGVLLGRVSKSR